LESLMTSRVSFPVPLALAATALLLAGCDRAGDQTTQQSEAPFNEASILTGEVDYSKAGAELPALTLTDPAGNALDLASLKGKPVLINLWATWCAPCVIEMPMLDNLAGQMGDDLRVVTVSQDLSGASVVEPFFAEREFVHLEPWLDQESELTFRFSQTGMLPLTVLFDAEGKEVLRVVGGYHWDSDETVALLREAIAE